MNTNNLTLFCLSLAVVGCQTFGPATSEEGQQLIKSALPVDDNNALFLGSGEWNPLTRGFSDMRSIVITGQKATTIMGGLAITDKAIYFSEWDKNANRYILVKKININDMQDILLDKYGVNRRFAVQNKDLTFDSFAFVSNWTGDTDKTVQVYEHLKQIIK